MTANDVLPRVQALLDAKRVADAARLLAIEARGGNTLAIVELAQWSIAGNIIPRDLSRARELLGEAASERDESAALLHASFLASGTGGDLDWIAATDALRRLSPRSGQAQAQLSLIEQMDIDDEGFPNAPADIRTLSDRPQIAVAENFLTLPECEHLIKVASPFLTPSVVIDPASGRLIPHPVRTSDGAMFGVHTEDLVVGAVNRRIAALTNTGYRQGEPLQMLRYRPGQEYRAHMDALASETNQRILTVILYLNDEYDGGHTHFPRTGLSFRGKAGGALVFANVTPDGRPDPMALHAGAPVTRGTKIIATRWIRRNAFTFRPPRPILPACP